MESMLGSNPMVNSLTRRGVHPGVLLRQSPLTAVTPSSPNYDPNMQAPQPFPSTPDMNRSPMSMVGQDALQAPTLPQGTMPANEPMVSPGPQQPAPQQPKWTPQNEGEVIVHSLIKRLEHTNKKEQKPGTSDQQEINQFDKEANRVGQEYQALIQTLRHGQDYQVPNGVDNPVPLPPPPSPRQPAPQSIIPQQSLEANSTYTQPLTSWPPKPLS